MAASPLVALESNPAYATSVALLDRLGGRPAGDALRAPFAMGDRDALVRLLRDAGARSVRASTVSGRGRFPSVRAMVEADLRGWLPLLGVVLDEDVIQEILVAADRELARHRTPEGSMAFDVSAHVVAGVKS